MTHGTPPPFAAGRGWDGRARRSRVSPGWCCGPRGAGYDTARRLYNRAVDRHQTVIARRTGLADVLAALRHARRESLRVVRYGGGHSFAGHSVCEDGLVIACDR